MNRIKSYHNFLVNEEFVSDFPYRVYKKTKDYYRIEERVGDSWEEIETDKDIENLLLDNCFLYVNEIGRSQAVNGEFKSSRDVPVHAWIECRGYEIDDELTNPDGVLYYNPFTVKKFTDRNSFEKNSPEVIHKCDSIGIKGNYLEYKGATVKVKDMSVLVNKELVSESINNYDYSMIYSPIDFIKENYHSGKEVSIRPITKDELKTFCDSSYASTEPEQNIFGMICNPLDNEVTHGAFEGNKIVGTVVFHDSKKVEGYTEISMIFVDPDNRQKEIGKLLIDYVMDNSKHKKLIANPYTDEAERFFLKIGFKKDEEIDPEDYNTVIR